MNIKQKGKGMYATKKYSELTKEWGVTTPSNRADWTVANLLKFGYAVMNSYNINEITKTIKSLRELGIEYTMKTIEGQESKAENMKWKSMYFEFTTVYFEDDRVFSK
jgi:hypothetical protein